MVTVGIRWEEEKLRFFDGVENVSTSLFLTRARDFAKIESSTFPIPVDTSVRVRTEMIEHPHVPSVTVRNADGAVIDTDPLHGSLDLDADEYLVGLSTPIALYIATSGRLRISADEEGVRLAFPSEQPVTIGAMVPHEHPRTTVTSSASVGDLFEAISTFGSAMRTFRPERSYQTMRGHPPLLNVGESLSIPETVTPPETDVRLAIPASYLHAAMASPLAYYLGARLVPARKARLEVADEAIARLRSGRGFAADCSDLLQRILFLDCLARSVRGYDIDLAAFSAVADRLSVDWEGLYDRSHADRLRGYLDLPAGIIRDAMPAWEQHAHVVPNVRTLETLPFLAYNLVSVRRHGVVATHPSGPRPRLATDGGAAVAMYRTAGSVHRSPQRLPAPADDVTSIGERRPIGLTRAFPAAFLNRLDREAIGDRLSIAVVCNDDQMTEELDFAESIYSSRDEFPVDVRSHSNLQRSELRALLQRPVDYFHYIGHLDEAGFECSDGGLDVDTIDQVGVESFFLNACDSIEQATTLVERGAIGGIATRHPVVNSGALRLGELVAELLIQGLPIGISLQLLRAHNVIGHKYSIVGDPTLAIANTESGIPYRCEVDSLDHDQFQLTVRSALTASRRHGSMASFHLGGGTPYFLNPTVQTFRLERETLLAFLELETVPVTIDGELTWSTRCRERLACTE